MTTLKRYLTIHAPGQDIAHWCTHHSCQCMAANDLAELADITGDDRYAMEAINVHTDNLEVPCRLILRQPHNEVKSEAAQLADKKKM